MTVAILIALIALVVGAALHQIGRPAASVTPAADHWVRRPTHVNPAWAVGLTSNLGVAIIIAAIFAGLLGINTLLH